MTGGCRTVICGTMKLTTDNLPESAVPLYCGVVKLQREISLDRHILQVNLPCLPVLRVSFVGKMGIPSVSVKDSLGLFPVGS